MNRTDFLFADNSFLIGMSQAIDLGATRKNRTYNFSVSSEEADQKALQADWYVIGQNMKEAYEKVTNNYAS